MHAPEYFFYSSYKYHIAIIFNLIFHLHILILLNAQITFWIYTSPMGISTGEGGSGKKNPQLKNTSYNTDMENTKNREKIMKFYYVVYFPTTSFSSWSFFRGWEFSGDENCLGVGNIPGRNIRLKIQILIRNISYFSFIPQNSKFF